jgi:septal ring-binding cell division protein DamX
LYIYNTLNRGQSRVGVLFGSFPDRASANAAQAALPKKLRDAKPLTRTVAGLRAEVVAAP